MTKTEIDGAFHSRTPVELNGLIGEITSMNHDGSVCFVATEVPHGIRVMPADFPKLKRER